MNSQFMTMRALGIRHLRRQLDSNSSTTVACIRLDVWTCEHSSEYDPVMTSLTTATHPWQAATALAAFKHRHQLRKDGRTPYVSHPVRVALTCAIVFGVGDDTTITAALLHDLIEDTTTDYDDLLERFGKDVADIVACLSKDARLIEPQREAAYDQQLAAGPWRARLIKLADVYDNLHDCLDDGARCEVLERAHRALQLAANDSHAETALDAVRSLVEHVEQRLSGARQKSRT